MIQYVWNMHSDKATKQAWVHSHIESLKFNYKQYLSSNEGIREEEWVGRPRPNWTDRKETYHTREDLAQTYLKFVPRQEYNPRIRLVRMQSEFWN